MLREHPATTTITTAIGRGSAIGRFVIPAARYICRKYIIVPVWFCPAARNASIMLDREDPESRRSDPRPIVGATAGNDWLPAALPWRPDKLKLFGRLGRSPHQVIALPGQKGEQRDDTAQSSARSPGPRRRAVSVKLSNNSPCQLTGMPPLSTPLGLFLQRSLPL